MLNCGDTPQKFISRKQYDYLKLMYSLLKRVNALGDVIALFEVQTFTHVGSIFHHRMAEIRCG